MNGDELFDLWFPGRGLEVRRPKLVPGTWKAYYDSARREKVISARLQNGFHSQVIVGFGQTSQEAMQNWLARAELWFMSQEA
jgi:hypothetical protein